MDLAKVPGALRPPFVLAHRLRRRIYGWLHPGEPWMEPGVIRFCERSLTRKMAGLEWGSGRSTAWFGKRLGSLLSVEHDAGWHAVVTAQVAEAGLTTVEVRLVPPDHDLEREPQRAHYDKPPAYVRVAEGFPDSSLDFVVVDGAYREACAIAAVPKLKPGGLLLVDDTRWFPLLKGGYIPADWPVVYESSTMISQTTVWRKPGGV